MKFIDTSVDELIPDPENARIHNNDNLEVIAESLREFGAARSIVVDKNGIVRAGNGTLEAAKRIGLKKARVVEATGGGGGRGTSPGVRRALVAARRLASARGAGR